MRRTCRTRVSPLDGRNVLREKRRRTTHKSVEGESGRKRENTSRKYISSEDVQRLKGSRKHCKMISKDVVKKSNAGFNSTCYHPPPPGTHPGICNFFLTWRSIPHLRARRKRQSRLLIDHKYIVLCSKLISLQ